MNLVLLIAIAGLFWPAKVESRCCRLPFTDGLCTVNYQGPHRYQMMPDRKSGYVAESTECFINDFDANLRTAVNETSACSDCPGLLILRTNSSEIFLFPEYLERILEGRSQMQRKNLVILTSSLSGAYDLDFSLFARFYESYPVEKVPSIYIDLELPPIDFTKGVQPLLRLRVPSDLENEDESYRINREELMKSLDVSGQPGPGIYALPFIYHFNIEKHRNQSGRCFLYEIHLTPTKLEWNRLDSEGSACHTFMPYFGRNSCFFTGSTRLFCPIHENIENKDRLVLSPYVKPNDRIEHLTLAVTGGNQVTMSLSNAQYGPVDQVKILLIQGHLVVTDVNKNMKIRVEYGWDCDDFSLIVPAGISLTKYRKFDGDSFAAHEKESLISLPKCFRLLPNFDQSTMTESEIAELLNQASLSSNDFDQLHHNRFQKPEAVNDSYSSSWVEVENQSFVLNFWNFLVKKQNLKYTIPIIIALLIVVFLTIALTYKFCCSEKHHGSWTLKHKEAQINEEFGNKNETCVDLPTSTSTECATQTKDQTVRI